MTQDVPTVRCVLRKSSFLSALLDISCFRVEELLDDYRAEIQLASSLNQLADVMPYPKFGDKIQRIAVETAEHANSLELVLRENRIPLPSVAPQELSPFHPSKIVSAVHKNADKICERVARYNTLVRSVPPTLRPLIKNIRDMKEHHAADIRDVILRIVR